MLGGHTRGPPAPSISIVIPGPPLRSSAATRGNVRWMVASMPPASGGVLFRATCGFLVSITMYPFLLSFLLTILSSCSWLLPSNAFGRVRNHTETLSPLSSTSTRLLPRTLPSSQQPVTCASVHTQPPRLLAAELGHSAQLLPSLVVTGPVVSPTVRHIQLLAPALLHLSLPQIKGTVSSSSVRSWA